MKKILLVVTVLMCIHVTVNADVSFTVNANEPYNITSDDIVRLKTLASGSGFATYIDDIHRPHLNSIGINTMRISIAPQAYYSAGILVYNWLGTKNQIDIMRRTGAEPFCTIGEYVPSLVSSDPSDPGSTNPIVVDVDQTKYENMVYDGLVFFNVTLGYKIKYFDVGNEPDTPGPSFPTDYLTRYNRYFNLYKYTVNAVTRYERNFPTAQRVQIGGPAGQSFSYNLTSTGPVRVGQFNYYERFITDCYNQSIRLDLISFHAYGNTAAYGGHSRGTSSNDSLPSGGACSWWAYPSYRQMLVDGWDEIWPLDGSHITMKSIKWLRDTYKPSALIYIGETSINSWGGSEGALINSTSVNAAFISTFLKDMMEYGIINKVIFTITNPMPYSDGSERWDFGGGLVTHNKTLTKAVYNSYRMIKMMAEERVATTGTDRDLHVISSKNLDKLTMLVTNHNYYGPDSSTAVETAVNININKLLFKSDVLKIKQNVVLNNSFEDSTGGVVNNWFYTSPVGWIIDDTKSYAGNKSLKVLSGYASAGLGQSYTILPNTTYTYSVMVKGENVVNGTIEISYDGGTTAHSVDIPKGTYDWIKITKTFTTASSAGINPGNIYAVVNGTSNGTYWFDNVEFGESIPTVPYVKYERYLVSSNTSNIYYLVENGLNVDGAEELQKVSEGTLERTNSEVSFPAFIMPKESVSLIVISNSDCFIPNSGFEETPIVQGWRNNYFPQGWEIDNTVSYSGQRSLKILNGYTSAGINRDYTFSPNTTYKFSVKVKGNNIVQQNILIARINGVYHSVIVPAGTYDWTTVSAEFTTGSTVGSNDLMEIVAFPDSVGTYWFDDAQLEKDNVVVDDSFEYLSYYDTASNDYSYATGFEGADNLQGWRNNYFPQGWIIDNTVSHSGQNSLKILNGYTSAGINRDHTFSPNTTYNFSVKVKGENIVQQNILIARINGVYHSVIVPAGTYDWTTVSAEFTTGSTVGSNDLIFLVAFPSSSGTYWLDEFELKKSGTYVHQFDGPWIGNHITELWQNNSYPLGYIIDDNVLYEGKSTLKINSGYNVPGINQYYTFSPKTTYTYSVMVKGQNVLNNRMAIANDGVCAYYMHIPTGTYDWTRVSTSFTTTPTAGFGVIHVVVDPASNGTYWFSDVKLARNQLQNGGFEMYHGLSAGPVAAPYFIEVLPDPGPGPIPDPIPIPPGVNISSPGDNSTIYQTHVITVTGTIDNNSAQVTVNGVSAVVVNNTFTASIDISPQNQPITGLIITATATYPDTTVITDTVTVNYDPNPPPSIPKNGPRGPILEVKGSPDYWVDNYSPRGWELDMAIAHTGVRSLKIKNGFVSAGLNQKYIFKPNKTYGYSVWVKGDNVVNSTIAIARVNTNVYYLQIPTGTYGWTKVTTQFTTPSTVGNADLIYCVVDQQADGTYWFDDVYIVE